MSTLGQLVGQLTLSAIAGGVVSTVLGKELSTRLSLLPRLLIRLAARHLPADMRADRIEEWNAELAAIAEQTEGLPLTRLFRGLFYAFSLFRNAGALASALTGRSRLSLALSAGRRTLTALAHLAAGCLLSWFIAFAVTAEGSWWIISWAVTAIGCLAIGALLEAVLEYAPSLGVLQRIALRAVVVGFGLIAVGMGMYVAVSAIKHYDDLSIQLGISLGVLGCAGLAYVVARGIVGPAVVTAFIILIFGMSGTSDVGTAAGPMALLLTILTWKYRIRIKKIIPLRSIKSRPCPHLPEHEDESV